MLERYLITLGFFSIAAINPASAADSNAICAVSAQETAPDALPGPAPITDCVQTISASTTSTSDNSQSQELLAAERYGKILLTALGKQLSSNEFLKRSSFAPSVDAEQSSFNNDMSFGAFEPFAPLFDDFDNTAFTDEDGVSWN